MSHIHISQINPEISIFSKTTFQRHKPYSQNSTNPNEENFMETDLISRKSVAQFKDNNTFISNLLKLKMQENRELR